MKNLFIGLLCCFLVSSAASQTRAVFFGNSYTYFNNLPDMVRSIALDKGDSFEYDAFTPGGQTLRGHASDLVLFHQRVSAKDYDYVIIQAQSQEPSFSPGQVASQTLPYARQLDSVINSIDTCIKTMFFMTWGRENGDQSNCANYPPICTYEGMQKRLRESYLLMASQNNAQVAPVGEAWKLVRDSASHIQLYTADGSHPSLAGSYLAACTFYCSMFHKTATTFYDPGVGHADAFTIQAIASHTVLDSLPLWGIDTNANIADSVGFSQRELFIGAAIEVKASDTTLTRYDWKIESFGADTVVEEFMDTSHTMELFMAGEQMEYPNYKVTLSTYQNCSSYQATGDFTNNFILGSISEATQAIDYNLVKGILHLDSIGLVEILSLDGRKVFSSQIPTFQADLRYLIQGVYFLQIISGPNSQVRKIYVH